MKLDHAPQAGLRRYPPDRRRERLAFWAGVAITAAFELVLMSKTWSPETSGRVFAYVDGVQLDAAVADQPLPDGED